MLLFMRSSELLTAEWSEIDLDKGIWIIPWQRMKMGKRKINPDMTDHRIDLPCQAVTLLQDLMPITGWSNFLFPKRGNLKETMTGESLLRVIKRMGYTGKMTVHGFRALATSWLREQRLEVNGKKMPRFSHEVEGKKRSSINAIKHGILSGRALLPHESKKDYSCLLEGLIDEFKPKGAYESFLVDKIALVMWKHKRLAITERASIETDSDIRGYFVKKSIHKTLHGHDDVVVDTLHYHIIEDYKSADADLAHWQSVLDECDKFERKASKDVDVTHEWLKAECPTLAVWAEQNAEVEEMAVDAYFRTLDLYD